MNIRLRLIAAIVLVGGGLAAMAASYSLMRLPTPGRHEPRLGGVRKVVQIEVFESSEATGTVEIYRQVPGSTVSNLEYTVTCSSGKAAVALSSTNTFYVAAGDVLYRSGTATNGFVRLIVQ